MLCRSWGKPPRPRCIAFVLPVNEGQALTILAGVLLGTALPILPLQILWVNMVTSSSLSIPLAFEPQPNNVMRSPPRQPNEPLLTGSVLWRVGIISLFNCVATFSIFQWVVGSTGSEALGRTMAVQTLVAAEIFYLLCISRLIPSLWGKMRHQHRAIQRGLGGFPHERLYQEEIAYAPAVGIACVVALQMFFSQLPVMNALFDTVPLNLTQWSICLGAGLPVVIFALLLKRFKPLG